MDPTLERRLRAGAAAVGVTVDERVVRGLSRYLDRLLFWNRTVNLTAVRDPAGIVDRHFVDSLAVLPHIPDDARTLVDVGSGAGFPGAVVALARPALAVALVESVRKKAAFLEALRRELPLPNVTVHAERVEVWTAGAQPGPDVAVSRATWDLLEWLDRGVSLVRPGGLVIGMEGGSRHQLGPDVTRHTYPSTQGSRAIVCRRAPAAG